MSISPISNGGSSNGRTADSDSANTGSNPVPPAISVIARTVPDAEKNLPVKEGMPIGLLLPNKANRLIAKCAVAVVPEYTDCPEMWFND